MLEKSIWVSTFDEKWWKQQNIFDGKLIFGHLNMLFCSWIIETTTLNIIKYSRLASPAFSVAQTSIKIMFFLAQKTTKLFTVDFTLGLIHQWCHVDNWNFQLVLTSWNSWNRTKSTKLLTRFIKRRHLWMSIVSTSLDSNFEFPELFLVSTRKFIWNYQN